jgi:hypothetical protein
MEKNVGRYENLETDIKKIEALMKRKQKIKTDTKIWRLKRKNRGHYTKLMPIRKNGGQCEKDEAEMKK